MTNFAPSAVVVSVVSLAILIAWDQVLIKRGKIFQLIQGPLVAVVVGIIYQVVTSAVAPEWALRADQLVKLPQFDGLGDVAGALVTPDWSEAFTGPVLLTALTIAIVASLETLLCVEATDKLDPVRRVTPTNRELMAQGAGNTLSGLIGGLPVTQVIVRSSANIQSGATSKVSAIWHGVLLLVAVVFAAPLMNLVPLAALAAILLVVGYKLAKPSLFKDIYDQGMGQFIPFMVTIVAILLTDLLTGVFLGLGVGLLGVLYRAYANSHWVDVRESDDDQAVHHVDMRLGEHVSFLSRGAILRQLTEIPDGSAVSLDLSRTHGMDHDVREILEDFQRSAERRKLTVEIIPPAPQTQLGSLLLAPAAQAPG